MPRPLYASHAADCGCLGCTIRRRALAEKTEHQAALTAARRSQRAAEKRARGKTAAEERATKILGAPVRALVSPFPETGVNVDRVSDVALAEAWVRTAS